MSKGWYFKFGIVIFLMVAPVICLWGAFDKDSWAYKVFKTDILKGLDLQGGIRLVYEVQIDQAIGDRRANMARSLQGNAQDSLGLQGIEVLISNENNTDFSLRFRSEQDANKCDHDYIRDWSTVRETDRSGREIRFTLSDDAIANVRETAVQQAVEIVRNRIDELGLANTSVTASGNDIIIEIPGRPGTEMVDRIKRIIKRTARLEFKIVDDEERGIYDKLRPLVFKNKNIKLMEEGHTFYLLANDTKEGDKVISGQEILKQFLAEAEKQGIVSGTDRIFGFEEISPRASKRKKQGGAEKMWRTYYLIDEAQVTGEHIQDAQIAYDTQEGNMPFVSINFNDEGKRLFGEVTTKNVKKRMAIILDEKVNSAPVIQEPIMGGNARITMGGYRGFREIQEEAKDLVVVLRAGALPAPITLINETVIGPSLGRDAINKGQFAAMVGALIVILFMSVYYRSSGVIANVGLATNIAMLVAIMSILGPTVGATLTLPGIAGIALTIGMSVDANIIIYERIREELRAGKSPKAAVEAGYDRAFLTIIDSQATTFISGVVLFQYGTGPIKGFAITLMIGIITNLVTAIFQTRVFMDLLIRGKKTERLSI